MSDLVNYEGKRVVVVGGSSGMGAATAQQAAQLGAEVIVLDVADIGYPCTQAIKVDLRDQTSVDAALDQIQGPVHAVLACAGVADGTPNIMTINFTSQRHLVEALVTTGKLGPGGSIGFISSVAGLGWMDNLDNVKEFLATPDWDTAAAWIDEHEGTDGYSFSKMAINCYVAQQAFPMLQKGLRINAIMPGPTDTPLAQANADQWLTFGADYREAADVPTLVPAQMSNTLLFLASDAASGVNGITMLVDQGHVAASLVDAFDAPLVKVLAGLAEFEPWMLGVGERPES
ncbi:MAG: SDR family oxidoreductase [Ilumatobacteraceae bacterium]|nr:SDR family oxidoreductase [Ilumatobacteraceae bacterium]